VSQAWPRRTTVGMPASQARGDRRRPAPIRGPITLPIAALIIVLAAAVGGAGSWYAIRTTPPPSARLSRFATPPVLGNSPPRQSAVAVSLAAPAALYPDAALIAPVIAAYFRAINSRDYAGYLTTQQPGHALTAQQFQTGFRSTEDSNVRVTSIAIAPDGRPAADVTFTSRQQPQDGPGGESCTNWHLTMFFDNRAGTYTLGVPPAGYHASYQACA
jgi:hypothetical protein